MRQLRGARIAYVAQSAAAAFNPAHRLLQQYCETPVTHGVMGAGDAAANGREIFAKLELPDPDSFGARYPHQVSGRPIAARDGRHGDVMPARFDRFDEPTTALPT